MQAYAQEQAQVFDGETQSIVTRTVQVKLETRYEGAGASKRPLVKCAGCGYVFPKSSTVRVRGKDYCRVNGCAEEARG